LTNQLKYFTTGPTELFPQIKDYIYQAIDEKILSISHRSDKFSEIYKFTNDNLKKLLGIPGDRYIFFLSSATECMERIIENLVEEKSFHFVNGYFAERFYNFALKLKRKPDLVKTGYGNSFDFENCEIPSNIELICITHNETSTGVEINLQDIYELKNKYPDISIALDIVTSVPHYKIDFSKIDVAFFSVQKGFGMPAGLGVMIVNPEVIEKARHLEKRGCSIGTYNSFPNLQKNADIFQTAMTPNILGIYLLGKVSEYLNNYGIEKIRTETEEKAEILYNFFDNSINFNPFVKQKSCRSETTIVIESKIYIHNALLKAGYVVSNGYAEYKDRHFRIGNFPMHRIEDVKNIIEILSLKEKLNTDLNY
jgi:phosphoserine aminotransferase